MKCIAKVALIFGAFILTACDAFSDPTPDYRYRLTVEVDTPQGLRSGSSVIEVKQSIGRTAMSGFGKAINYRVRGEAVAVDLPDGRTLFALLRSKSDSDWAGQVVSFLAPDIEGESWEESFDNVLLIDRKLQVPRMWPARGGADPLSAYPILVTFGDIAEPTSVVEVDPNDLAATFGEGYALRRITVELTDKPVTTGIEKRLGWFDQVYKMGLRTEQFPKDFPVGDFQGLFKKDY